MKTNQTFAKQEQESEKNLHAILSIEPEKAIIWAYPHYPNTNKEDSQVSWEALTSMLATAREVFTSEKVPTKPEDFHAGTIRNHVQHESLLPLVSRLDITDRDPSQESTTQKNLIEILAKEHPMLTEPDAIVAYVELDRMTLPLTMRAALQASTSTYIITDFLIRHRNHAYGPENNPVRLTCDAQVGTLSMATPDAFQVAQTELAIRQMLAEIIRYDAQAISPWHQNANDPYQDQAFLLSSPKHIPARNPVVSLSFRVHDPERMMFAANVATARNQGHSHPQEVSQLLH